MTDKPREKLGQTFRKPENIGQDQEMTVKSESSLFFLSRLFSVHQLVLEFVCPPVEKLSMPVCLTDTVEPYCTSSFCIEPRFLFLIGNNTVLWGSYAVYEYTVNWEELQ